MNIADFRSQLEAELDWRTKEIFFSRISVQLLKIRGKKKNLDEPLY